MKNVGFVPRVHFFSACVRLCACGCVFCGLGHRALVFGAFFFQTQKAQHQHHQPTGPVGVVIVCVVFLVVCDLCCFVVVLFLP